tara:strand:+ start:1236 stop:1511 length:276 start_codon:yes stop_codon:yes gene_type:complete
MSNLKRKFNEPEVTYPQKFIKIENNSIYNELISIKKQLSLLKYTMKTNFDIINNNISLLNTLINFKINAIENQINKHNYYYNSTKSYDYYS